MERVVSLLFNRIGLKKTGLRGLFSFFSMFAPSLLQAPTYMKK
ncbi:hypothetical protein [Laceyella putida]|uniref:Uncharacterized protein n=1 Tax=Laceyella putida TaxID=110101 RepID=A0ABW2RJC5_9BACL